MAYLIKPETVGAEHVSVLRGGPGCVWEVFLDNVIRDVVNTKHAKTVAVVDVL